MFTTPLSSRAVGLVTGLSLVVGMAVSPATAAATTPAQAISEADVLLDPDRAAPQFEAPDYEVPATEFPAGEFDATEPVALSEPVKFVGGGDRAAPQLDAEDLASLPVVVKDEFSTTYDRGDGVLAEVISQEQVHIRNDEGEFVDVATSASFSDGRWVVDPHPMSPSFAGSASETDVVRFSMDGYEVGFTLVGARNAQIESPWFPWFQGPRDEVRYPDVFDNVDLSYTVSGNSIKEILELSQAPATGENSWTWFVTANALDMETDESGDILFVNRYDEVEFVIPAPIMWDSAGIEEVREPALTNVDTAITEGDGGWYVTLSADAAWLNDTDRVYPVFVDPTAEPNQWVRSASSYKAYQNTGASRTDGIHVGNSRAGGDTLWRTVVRYPHSPNTTRQVIDAYIGAWYNGSGTTSTQNVRVYSASCTSGFSCLGTQFGSFDIGSGSATWGNDPFDVWLADRLRDGRNYSDIVFRGSEAAGAYTYKKLNAQLIIFYKWYPQPSIPADSPVAGGVDAPLRPTFKVDGTHSSGYDMQYAVEVREAEDAPSSNPKPGTTSLGRTMWQDSKDVVYTQDLEPNTRYVWKAWAKDDFDGHNNISTQRSTSWGGAFTTQATPPPQPTEASAVPAGDDAVVISTTPTFSVAQVEDTGNEGQIKYQFRIATGDDANDGMIVESGWIDEHEWTPPAGALQNGNTYTWQAMTRDHIDENMRPEWVNSFRVDQRLGTSGPSPFDAAGPATVNLANGNLALNFSSPMVSTVGGSMGLNFTYNSQSPVAYQPGLDAEYFNVDSFTNPPAFPAPPAVADLQRVDSAVNFNWGEDSAPGSGIDHDHFLARWTGFISVPATGEYKFGFSRDDGARLTIDGNVVYDEWNAARTKDWADESVYLIGGTRIPVLVEFAERRGAAKIEMLSKFRPLAEPAVAFDDEIKVPASWFSRDGSILPGGWASSAPIAGNGGFFTSAQVNDNSIVLTDVSGSVHTFTRKADKSWKPPSAAYGTVAVDSSGKVTYTDLSGYTHAFASNGNLTSSSGPSEATRPAEPQAQYDGNSRRVTKIIDPVSKTGTNQWGRELKFYYGGDSQCASGVGEGYGDAPDGMLCQIVYPTQVSTPAQPTDIPAQSTDLYYTTVDTGDDEVAFLSAIRDPGNEWTVFDYDSTGKLSSIIDSMGNDYFTYFEAEVSSESSALAAIDDLIRTDIAYDADGRVEQVLLPSADPQQATQRMGRVYEYDDATNTTEVFAYAPDSGNNVLLSTVTYDDTWRATSTTSAMGITSSQQWHPSKDMLVSAVDAAGRKSTKVYDREDRPVTSYGPAAGECFTGVEPNSTCDDPVPTSTTAYDEGMQGLQVQYWKNRYLTGQPDDFMLDMSQNISPNGVDLSLGSGGFSSEPSRGDDWSIRLIGEIEFPSVGDWTLSVYDDDGTRIWVDDILVFDDWHTTGSTRKTTDSFLTVSVDSAEDRSRSIRIDHYEDNGSARLKLHWSTDGGDTPIAVPLSALTPNYGLTTSSVVDESETPSEPDTNSTLPSLTTQTGYSHPWLGAATEVSVDPSGLNLTTKTAFEPESATSGWLRRIEKRLPTAVANGATADDAGLTFDYWGDTETFPTGWGAEVCSVANTVKQWGMQRTSKGPTAADDSWVMSETVYDALGRVAGTRVITDQDAEDWSCITYDGRNRPESTTVPDLGTSMRTITNDYEVGDDPRVSTVTDAADGQGAIRVETDLLGRTVAYTDVWGVTTAPTYAPVTGRVLSTTIDPPAGDDVTQEFTYDADGKVLTITDTTSDPDVLLATATYNVTTGELEGVAYANESALTGLARSGAGAPLSMTWDFPDLPAVGEEPLVSQPSVTDSVVRSQSGRIIANTLTDGYPAAGGTAYRSAYQFDAAARLTQATLQVNGDTDHVLSYSFDDNLAECTTAGITGAVANAGLNGNRTSYTDKHTVYVEGVPTVTETSTSYCYDQADRLLASTVSGDAIPEANPVADGLAPAELAYDAHGNTTTLADQLLEFDLANRHLSTTVTDAGVATKVSYTRDVTNRIVARTVTVDGVEQSATRYAHSAAADVSGLVLDALDVVPRQVV